MKTKLMYAAVAGAFASFGRAALKPVANYVEDNFLCYAVANTKATEVTNADATPQVKTAVGVSHGRLHRKVGTVEVAAADDDLSVYRICRVHSSWFIDSITRFNDAITSGASYNVGIHDTAENGAAAVNADLFSSAISLTSASKVGVNDMYESADIDINQIEQALWQMLGLTSDSGKWYDLTYSAVTAGSGAGTISVRVTYVAND